MVVQWVTRSLRILPTINIKQVQEQVPAQLLLYSSWQLQKQPGLHSAGLWCAKNETSFLGGLFGLQESSSSKEMRQHKYCQGTCHRAITPVQCCTAEMGTCTVTPWSTGSLFPRLNWQWKLLGISPTPVSHKTTTNSNDHIIIVIFIATLCINSLLVSL